MLAPMQLDEFDLLQISPVGCILNPAGFWRFLVDFPSLNTFSLTSFILVFQSPRERVRRRARNTMSGMLNAVLESYLTNAMNAMTDSEIQQLDQNSSRIGLSHGRIVEISE